MDNDDLFDIWEKRLAELRGKNLRIQRGSAGRTVTVIAILLAIVALVSLSISASTSIHSSIGSPDSADGAAGRGLAQALPRMGA